MFHCEKIVENVRSASAPEEGELLIRLPVEHADRAKTIWLEKLFGKLLDPDLAGPIRRAVQGVRSVQTTACAPAGSGGPSPPWWSLLQGCTALPSRRARECAVITRCAVTTCGPPVPNPVGSCHHPITHAYGPRRRRRAAAAGGGARVYSHIKPEMEHL